MKYGIQCWKWRVSSTDEVVFCFGFNGLRSGFMAATTSLVLFSFWGIFLRPNFRFASSFTTSASALRSILSFFFSFGCIGSSFFLFRWSLFFILLFFFWANGSTRADQHFLGFVGLFFVRARSTRGFLNSISPTVFLQQFIVVSCFTIGRNKSLINGTNVSKKNSHVFVSAVLSVKEANVRPFGFRNVSVMKHWNVVLLRPHKVGLRSPFHLDSIT